MTSIKFCFFVNFTLPNLHVYFALLYLEQGAVTTVKFLQMTYQICELISGFLPAGLPTSCLTMAPRFDTLKPIDVSRKPLTEVNGEL